MPMPNFKLVALTRPVPGREDEYHNWYNTVHLPELVNQFKMKGAQRYQLVAKLIGADENDFLAIYDVECDDPGVFLGQMGEAAASGKMTPSDATDAGTTYTALFGEYGPRVEQD
jgi:hypothetical protein